GDELLAGPRLSGHEHGGVRRRHALEVFEHTAQGGASPHDASGALRIPEFFLQIFRLGQKLPNAVFRGLAVSDVPQNEDEVRVRLDLESRERGLGREPPLRLLGDRLQPVGNPERLLTLREASQLRGEVSELSAGLGGEELAELGRRSGVGYLEDLTRRRVCPYDTKISVQLQDRVHRIADEESELALSLLQCAFPA